MFVFDVFDFLCPFQAIYVFLCVFLMMNLVSIIIFIRYIIFIFIFYFCLGLTPWFASRLTPPEVKGKRLKTRFHLFKP
ncbi:hypothetical protein Hanom_Chr07g00663901 [Helianthus anomalus]